MTDAPDMIWTSKCGRALVTDQTRWADDVPYRRADLPRPEDAARIAELEAALAKMRRSRDRYREEWERAKARECILSEGAAND